MPMKKRINFLWVLVISVQLSGHSQAATAQYWNVGGTGGDGNWGSSPGDKNWNTTAGAPSGNVFWPDTIDDVAIFQDLVGGTVTVFDAVQTSGIIQNGADYTLNAGGITLVRDSTNASPSINVRAGSLSIDTPLDGSDGLIKTGGASLHLTNSNTYSGVTTVAAGSLTLSGTILSNSLDIAAAASFIDVNGGLPDSTLLTNAGSMTLKTSETVASYTSNGGTLADGPGTLLASTATLNHRSSIAGRLDADTVYFKGANTNSGTVTADSVFISSGTLFNTGFLGANSSKIDIATGAVLVAGGTQQYSLLTTSGPAAGAWHGDLKNPSTIAPGAKNHIGTLDVFGDFKNLSIGAIDLDLSSSGHDRIRVAGTAMFGGTLRLNQLGDQPIPAFVPIQVVAADEYKGDISTLKENLEGAVWFNPGNGTVTRTTPPIAGAKTLFGATENQTSTWVALYDDVIEPGTANVTQKPGTSPDYKISSGLADKNNPDLMWALAFSFDAPGLNANLLNHLSPEVYTSFADYATQTTRNHQRTAMSAPALAAPRKPDAKAGLAKSPEKSAKDGIVKNPFLRDWEFFAATDYFNLETDNSRNLADYELSGLGIVAGGRTKVRENIQLASYLAVDGGSVSGPLIDADGIGWSIGMITETLLHEKSRTKLTAAASYGRYSFEGSRTSASATSAGWMPGDVDFSDIDSQSLELFVGIETLAYQKDGIRLIPSAGFRYARGTLDNISEKTTSTPGSPIALEVGRDSHDSLLFEMAVLAETDLTEKLSVWSQLGFNAGISENPHIINSVFAKGSRQMTTGADGLTDDLIFIGFGAEYRINESISIGAGYRGEFRPSHHTEHGFSISSSFRF
jgi:autotransporter-associated beta strand protein